jgi:shikimate kinase
MTESGVDPATRTLIKDKTISVWLRAELDVLFERVSRRGVRPLLKTDDPKGTMAELIELRYPIYAEADIIVDSGDGPISTMVDRVIAAVTAYLSEENVG